MAHDLAVTPSNGADPQPSAGSPAGGEGPRTKRLRRIHALLGVGILGPWLVYHLAAQHLTAIDTVTSEGGSARFAGATIVGLVVLVVLALHALGGLHLAARPRGEPPTHLRPRGWSRGLQLGTGLAALGFVALHLWAVGARVLVGTLDPSQAHAWLGRLLSTSSYAIPSWGLVHLLGLAICVTHLGHGLWGSASGFGLAPSRRAERLVALVCGIFSLVLVTLGGDAVVRLATGDGIDWPWRERSHDRGEPLPGQCPPPEPAPTAVGPRERAPADDAPEAAAPSDAGD